MKKKVLRFSKPFTKLYEQTSAILLHVEVRRHDQLDLRAVKLDTRYKVTELVKGEEKEDEAMPVTKEKYVNLPKTTLLVLVFVGNKDIPFTTFRKYNMRKWQRLEQEAKEKTVYEIVVEDPDAKKKV